MAGTAVDSLLFPLDTLKTRLQSPQGLRASGGFKGMYSGLGSTVLGSAPSAALFFVTYEYVKLELQKKKQLSLPMVHMMAASLGEISACTIRVPTEIIKQRMQTGRYSHYLKAFQQIWKSEGLFGFYRGYQMTLFREVTVFLY